VEDKGEENMDKTDDNALAFDENAFIAAAKTTAVAAELVMGMEDADTGEEDDGHAMSIAGGARPGAKRPDDGVTNDLLDMGTTAEEADGSNSVHTGGGKFIISGSTGAVLPRPNGEASTLTTLLEAKPSTHSMLSISEANETADEEDPE
jgi:hypothetical protein